MRRFLPILLLFLLAPAVAGSTIAEEDVVVDLGQEQAVTVDRYYTDITSDHISLLVPAEYRPGEFSARDAEGELDCSVDSLDIGTEILCEPRYEHNYSVTISFTGDFIERADAISEFSYRKQVSVPTDRVRFRVVLPEGYGLLQGANAEQSPYSPGGADTGSEGRRIFVEWTQSDVSLGDTYRFTARYEELAVFEQAPLWLVGGAALVIAVVIAGAVLYVRRNGDDGEETIAAIFPVLKEDEQAVLRYLIDEDGEAEQREVVQAVDYSKAKVSRLLSDLADRDILEKEKSGRINIVRLTREVGDID